MSAVTTSNSTAVANGTSTSVANGTTGGLTTTTTNGTTGGTTKTGTTGTSNGLTNSSATTHSNKTLSLTLNDNWTESWTLDPVTDPDVLRRLSALYRYVLGESVVKESEFPDEAVYRQHVEAQFMCEYPINQSPATASAGDPPTVATVTNAQGDVEMVTKTAPDASAKDSDSVTLVFKCRVGASDKLKIRITKVKRSDLKLPNCVICLDEDVGKLKVSLYKSQADEDAAKRLADLVAIIDDAAHAAEAAGAAMKAADAAEAQAKDANVKAAAAPADTDAARSAQADAIAKRAAAVAARAKADTARVNAKTEKVAADAAVETATEPVVKDAPPRPKTITETSRKEITEPAIKVGAETVYIADAGAFSDENILWDGGNDNHNLPYVNPALIFKLITTSKPNNCRPDVCGFGGSGSHSFYGAKTDAMTEPKRAFHDFELFVSAATQVPSASTSGGANKKAVGVSVSPDAFVLR